MTALRDPGRLRTPLLLEQVALTPDGQGGHAETWNVVATVFARLRPARVSGVFGADQTLETVTHDITLRARDDLASGMRFRDGTRHFVIITVHDPDESGRYLVCATRETGR